PNDCPPVGIAPTSLPGGVAGQSYSQALSASGGVPPHTFSLYSGVLPVGLSLSVGGTLSGTPVATGQAQFVVAAIDGAGCAGFQSYDIFVVCDTITVSPAILATGTIGVAYSQTITATGGAAPLSFAVT